MAFKTVHEAQRTEADLDRTHPRNPFFTPDELCKILGIRITFETPGGGGVRIYKVVLTDNGDGKPEAVLHAYN